MRNIHDGITALVAALLVTLAAPAHAQEQSPAHAREDADSQARALYRQGDRLYVQGKYEQAIAAFQESYRLSSRPLILYAIANTYERMGRYEEALGSLREYEPHAQRGEEQDLQERIRSLEQRLEAQQRDQAASGGRLAATERATGSARAPARPLAGWVLAGAGAASLATGAIFGLVARNAKNDIGDGCQGAGDATLCLADAGPLVDRNRRYARLADASMAIGAVALTAGIVVLVTGGEDAPAEQPVLSFAPGYLEVGFVGRF